MSGGSDIDWPLTIGAISAGFVTIVGALARGVKWMYARADRREARAEAREEAYNKRIENKLQEFENKLNDLWACFSIVSKALHDESPHHPAFDRVSKILSKAFPLSFDMPEDFRDAMTGLDKLNGVGGRKPRQKGDTM